MDAEAEGAAEPSTCDHCSLPQLQTTQDHDQVLRQMAIILTVVSRPL